MRITSDYKKNKMKSGQSSLKEASENAPRTKGFYTLLMDDEKLIMKVAENGLREEFIKLYNGFHLEGLDSDIKVYENRDKIIVDWVEEYSLEDAKEYVEKVVSTEEFKWM